MQPLQAGTEVFPELLTQQAVVDQVRLLTAAMFGVPRAEPARAVGRRAAAGHEYVDVRMMFQFLVPGVQHH